MKKAVIILLIFTILFTAIPYNPVCATSQMENLITQADTELENQNSKMTDNIFSLIGSLLTNVFISLPHLVRVALTFVILPDNVVQIKLFTIEDLLFGRFELFNVDFMNVSSSKSGSLEYVPSSTNVLIKENVAKWFYAMRNFAIVALLAVLIYIGILMATSTISSDKAKYKNMLVHWFVSFAILMVLPYIMSLAINVSESCVSVIRSVAEQKTDVEIDNSQIATEPGLNFENALLYGKVNEDGTTFEGILSKIHKGTGWEAFSLLIVYCMLAYYQFKFFFMYLKRMLTVGFLIVIAPLITITYSIDKAGDNQAQAYNTWLKEFLANIFIQPLHALLFLVFMYSISGIMERAPLLAIIFLASLSRGEQLFKTIFKIEGGTMGALSKRKGK